MIIDPKTKKPFLKTASYDLHNAWYRFLDDKHALSVPSIGDAIDAYKAIGYTTMEFELVNPREVVEVWEEKEVRATVVERKKVIKYKDEIEENNENT